MSKLKVKDLEELWKITLAQIEIKIDSPVYFKTWFKGTKLLKIEKEIAEIGVGSSYAVSWIQKKNHDLVKETLSYVAGTNLEPVYIYSDEVSVIVKAEKQNDYSMETHPLINNPYTQNGFDYKQKLGKCGLNIKYNFSNFIVGNSNRLAHAAALAVADNPGSAYNPFYIYGGSGLGKTHLMQAIGAKILEKNPNALIKYTSSEEFLNELVAAIRSNNGHNFRNKYRKLDVLIIDDIQFISNWQETQNELFHTFNSLYQANKQIIFASDRRPEEIKNLEERLKSRFQGGMVADISAPDYEHRLAIIEQKTREMGLAIDDITKNYIASTYITNIREIEGALSKISLVISVMPEDQKLNIKEIEKILGRDPESRRKKTKVDDVIKVIADYFGVESKELKGERRTALVAFPRQVCMYVLREDYKYPLEKVAEFLNRSDHTTVLHAVDKIKTKIMKDDDFRSKMNDIKHSLEV